MDLQYKSSQSNIDSKRAEHNRIPIGKIQENTSALLDFIENEYLEGELSQENINQYLERISFWLDEGAKVNVLARKNLIFEICNYYHQLYVKTIENGYVEHELDLFFDLLEKISKSNDDDCLLLAQCSKFYDFLTIILNQSKESYILSRTIDLIVNFVYEKKNTAYLFDYDVLINRLYKNYNEYFFMNRVAEYIGDLTEEQIIQDVIIRSFELIIVLLVCNPSKVKNIDEVVYRITISINNILENQRSNKNLQLYHFQLRMCLTQLYYILTNSDYSICDRFSTFLIVKSILKNLDVEEEITILALNCLKQYALNFAAAFYIVKKQAFVTFRPDEDKFKDENGDLMPSYFEAIKIYCQVWINCLKTILTSTPPSKGRSQAARISIQQCAQDILLYLKDVNEIQDDFDYQKQISLTFIAFANYNDDNTLNHVCECAPHIIDKIDRVLEERNPDDIFLITYALINIIDHFIKGGGKDEDIGQDLADHQDNIHEGLDEVREILHDLDTDPEQLKDLDELIDRIGELIGEI